MKRIVTAAAAALCAATLSGCVLHTSYGPGRLYYDGAYGEFYGGFWGKDGVFYYYTDQARTAAKRDDGRHFRANPQGNDVQVLATTRDRNAERVANGLPPEPEHPLARYSAR